MARESKAAPYLIALLKGLGELGGPLTKAPATFLTALREEVSKRPDPCDIVAGLSELEAMPDSELQQALLGTVLSGNMNSENVRELVSACRALAEEQRTSLLVGYAKRIRSSRSYCGTVGIAADTHTLAGDPLEPNVDDIYVDLEVSPAETFHTLQREQTDQAVVGDDTERTLSSPEGSFHLEDLRSAFWEKLAERSWTRPISQILESEPTVVLRGDPGAGKTTLLKMLCIRWATPIISGGAPTVPVPVVVSLGAYSRAFAEANRSGQDYPLHRYLANSANEVLDGLGSVVSDLLASGQLLILLDGVDECEPAVAPAVAHAVAELITTYGHLGAGNRCLVTSRFFGYQPMAVRAFHAVVRPFSDSQIRAFATNWFRWLERRRSPQAPDLDKASADASHFLEIVARSPRVWDLARNPLLLTTIAIIVRLGRDLPERRVELYDLALTGLIVRWNRVRSIKGTPLAASLDAHDTCDLWAPIALWMQESGIGLVPERALRQQLEDQLSRLDKPELGSASDWLSVRGNQSCLLCERGPGIFSFIHPTFREYLAAQALCADDAAAVDKILAHAHDPRWREVVLLAVAYVGVVKRNPRLAERIIRAILDGSTPYEALLHRNLFLAAACIADNVRVPRSLELDIIRCLLELSAGREHLDLRLQALRVAAEIDHVPVPDETVKVAASNLSDPDWQVRYHTLRWLSRVHLSTPDRVASLADQAAHDEDPDVRALALALAAVNDPSPSVLARAIPFLRKPIFPNTRNDVVHILSSLSHFTAPLVELLAAEDDDVRLSAAEVLLDRGASTGEAEQALVDLLSAENAEVRLSAAEVLLDRGASTGEAEQALVDLLSAENAEVRSSAAWVLLEKGVSTGEAEQALVDLLSAENAEVRWSAAWVLVEKGVSTGEAEQAVVDLLSAENDRVRLSAAWVLVEKGVSTGEAEQAVVDLLSAENDRVRLSAAEVLLDRGASTGEAEQAVVDLLSAENDRVRLSAARVLLEKGVSTGEAEQALVGLLSAENAEVRLSAARVLLVKEVSTAEAVAALTSLIGESAAGGRILEASLAAASRAPNYGRALLHALAKAFPDLPSQAKEGVSPENALYLPCLMYARIDSGLLDSLE